MKLTVMNYKTGDIQWTVESELIIVYDVKNNNRDYLSYKAGVQIFDNNFTHLGTLKIDYGSKWELL